MKIGIDIDDTICDTWNYTLPLMCKYYKKDLDELKKSVTGYYETGNLTLKDYMVFAKNNHQDYILKIPLIKNAKEIINRLKEEGNQIIFITARSENGYNNPYEITHEYLKNNDIVFDKLYVSGFDKKDICDIEKIDLFIDDNFNNCVKVQELGIDVLLFGLNSNFNGNQINDWEKIYEYVNRKKVKYGYKNCNK